MSRFALRCGDCLSEGSLFGGADRSRFWAGGGAFGQSLLQTLHLVPQRKGHVLRGPGSTV